MSVSQKVNQLIAFAGATVLSVGAMGTEKARQSPNHSGLVMLAFVGDRSTGDLKVNLTNVSDRELEIDEFKLPWAGSESLNLVLVTQGVNCPPLTEYRDLTHPGLVRKYIVLPPGFTVTGTVNVFSRWPALKSRPEGCRDEIDWQYEFVARVPKARSTLKGRVSWTQ